jgi:hypothetical protein
MSRARFPLPLVAGALLLAALLTPASNAAAAGTARAAAPGHDAHAAKKKAKRCGRRHRRRGWSRRDLDGDHVPNRRDRDIDGDHIRNRKDCDIDGDGRRNGKDRDTDGDRTRNRRDRETDQDGTTNKRDRDIDQDGLRNCPRDKDMDGDGVRNQRDRDMDGDGIRNHTDTDVDGDGIGNRKDQDDDCDRIPDFRDDDSDASGDPVDSSVPATDLPASFFGVVAEPVAGSVGAARQTVLDQVASTGVRTLRQKFQWALIEKSPGVYDFRLYDGYLRDLVRRGFSVLPILFDPPSWRASGPSSSGTWPPRSANEFAAFATRVVQRYGPHGSFWSANPTVPYRPLRAWQIWNEPHIKAYWPGGPNPAEYVAMARPVAAAIKRADPGAEVVAAALSESNIGVPMNEYLEGMYAAGAAPIFDTLAIHPYASAADQVFDIMDRIRDIANAHGDASARIWMTELGWATSGPVSPYNIGEVGQAELIKRVWAVLVRERERLSLRGMIYFNWQDQEPYAPSFKEFFGLHTGLHRLDSSRKPAFGALSDVVHQMESG